MMNVDVFEIFNAVVDLPPEEQEAEIQRRCHGAPEALALLRDLLVADATDAGEELNELLENTAKATMMSKPPILPPRPLVRGGVIGRYQIEALLDGHGAAQVWRVRHLQRGNLYALKVFSAPTLADSERLLAEGRALASLEHPNIVPVVDVLELSGGIGLMMAMVGADGDSLRDRLRHAPLPLSEAIPLSTEILEGCAHAHRQAWVHHNLTPTNILLAPTHHGDVPQIVGFGLSRREARSARARPHAGVSMGTPGYMAPEQYEDTANVDARADVFALGCILYELLTQTAPFSPTDHLAGYHAARHADFPAPEALAPNAPAALWPIIRMALQPAPEARHANANAMLIAWRNALTKADHTGKNS